MSVEYHSIPRVEDNAHVQIDVKVDKDNKTDKGLESIPMEQILQADGNDGMIFFKLLRKFMSACTENEINVKKLELLRNKYKSFLKNVDIYKVLNDENLQNVNTSEKQKQFKEKLRKALLDEFYKKCEKNSGDLGFFAAATCHKEKLNEIIKNSRKILDETRCCDSILVFMLKYGNIETADFCGCVDLLIQSNVDINKPDFNGKTVIEHVVTKYSNSKDKIIKTNLQDFLKLLIQKEVLLEFLDEETIISIKKITENNDPLQQKQLQNQDKNKLFFWIGREKPTQFLQFENIGQFVDCDNGELTLLQFACEKSENMCAVVRFLLESGADPNKTTKLCQYHPVEIAARRNNEESFKQILKNQKFVILEEMFNRFFGKWNSNSVQQKYFEMFLKSEKLDPTFICNSTGDMAITYAVRFCQKETIQTIFNHAENQVNVSNKSYESFLDMITTRDLERHFDSCLDLGKSKNFSSKDYKISFDFNSLLSIRRNNLPNEVKIVSRISENQDFQQLLTHPLIHTFIMLKWSKIEFYHKLLLSVQFFLFLNLSTILYYLPYFSSFSSCTYLLYFSFFIINFILKIPFIVWYHIRNKCLFPTYEALEILLMLTLLGAFFRSVFQALAFVEMLIILVLTVSLHPKFGRSYAMLKAILKTFINLMTFFFLILLTSAFVFHHMFRNEHYESFKALQNSVLTVYFMLTGEYNINDKINCIDTRCCVIFWIFLIFRVLFWLSFLIVAIVAAIDIKKNSEKEKFKHVIGFLKIVETFFPERMFVRVLPKVLLFSNLKVENVDFYINRKDQFNKRKNFPRNVGFECTHEIKNFCRNKNGEENTSVKDSKEKND